MHAVPSTSDIINQSIHPGDSNIESSSSSIHSQDADSSLILRIKRKRGADPVSALRIELSNNFDTNDTRHDLAPLETSNNVNESRKRRQTDRGVFRLAETVTAASFSDADAAKRLEKRLVDRKRDIRTLLSRSRDDQKTVPIKDDTTKPREGSVDASALRFKIVKPVNKILSGATLRRKGSSGSLKERAVYGKLGKAASRSSPRIGGIKGTDSPRSIGKSPLVNRVRFVDAVIDTLESKKEGTFEGKRGKARHPSLRAKVAAKAKESSDEDIDMTALDRRFADLLGTYLKENDLEPPSDLYDSVNTSKEKDSSASETEDDSEDEYVYDIYFREKETKWGSGPAGAADAGLRPAEVAGHEEEEQRLQLGKGIEAGPIVAAEPMATLVGFTEEDDIISEMENATKQMTQEVQNDSDDDFDEGEDEDSNDEGFYRNDYPEDEDAENNEDVEDENWAWAGPRRRRDRGSSNSSNEGRSGGEDSDDDY